VVADVGVGVVVDVVVVGAVADVVEVVPEEDRSGVEGDYLNWEEVRHGILLRFGVVEE